MKTRIYKGTEERLILTALVVHDEVLEKVHRRLVGEKKPFKSRWSNLIAHWCFQHWEKYAKAPRSSIQILFQRFADQSKDPEAVELVESFLSGLSEDHINVAKELNAPFVIDLAAKYFEKIRLERLATRLQEAVEKDDLKEAKLIQSGYEPLTFAASDWSNPLSDDSIKDVFRYYEKDKGLIKWPGELNVFFTPYFERDGFIAFAGPEKRGKSFWLQETVWLAVRQRRKVLYYVLGDMSKEQVLRRLFIRIARRPKKGANIRIPKTMRADGDGEIDIAFEYRQLETIDANAVYKARARLQTLTATKDFPLQLQCTGGGVLCAGDIERDIANFTKKGWVPDVVVVDYADELAAEPSTHTMDKRHQINENWRILRRIALNNHCLVVTATQAAARSYDAKVIRKKDFSEDKRKNAHVTGLIGLNQFGDEKKLGVYRLNWILLREGEWSDSQVVYTAGNLALGNPCFVTARQSEKKSPRKQAREDNSQ